MIDFKLSNYIVSISWIYPDDKWFGFDSWKYYKAFGFGLGTICFYREDYID